jgi:hypothetical protein
VLTVFLVGRLIKEQKKLESEEEEASDDLLALHEKMAALQSELALAAGRLARIRKIRSKVKSKSSELFRRGMAELDKEDGIDLEPALDAHEEWVAKDLQFMGVSNDVDWSAFGLGDDLSGASPLVLAPSGVIEDLSDGVQAS